MTQTLAEDRRSILLQTLEKAGGGQLNETILRRAAQMFGHFVDADQTREDMRWLAESGLIRIEKLPTETGEIWIGHLTERGCDVALGRAQCVGVARRLG